MLHVSKGKISLQVFLRGEKVYIIHRAGEFQDRAILDTITRNEQLLARIHLTDAPLPYSEQQLRDYYTRRGWHVKESVPSV